jgi:hypothetical protein
MKNEELGMRNEEFKTAILPLFAWVESLSKA